MYHYIALTWNTADPIACAAAIELGRPYQTPTGWSAVFRANGMIVYAAPPRERSLKTYQLPRDQGIVLGRVFSSKLGGPGTNLPPTFDDDTVRNFVNSSGQSFIKQYWGVYVAFLWDAIGGTGYVFRDCSGKIPCYRTRHDGVEIIFSDIPDLSRMNLPVFSINASYLAAFIYSPELQVRPSALNEVTELLAGECLEAKRSVLRQFTIWDPVRVCQARAIENFRDAADELRWTTQCCIEAWSTVFDNILLRLSGGLDSAIVLGCLRSSRAPETITCANIFSEHPAEDERYYARIAAARGGVRLVEQVTARHVFDRRQFSRPRQAKPGVTQLFETLEREGTNRTAIEANAETVWTGQGGDHLFMQLHTSLSAADYVSRRGISRGLPQAIADAARLSKEPYWFVLRSALRLEGHDTTWQAEDILKREMHFVRRDALPSNADEYIAGPWRNCARSLPRGKRVQVNLLAEVLNRHRPLPNFEYAFEHHPLLSQPIIELCLQIPTYLLIRGGQERALARYAFNDCVPPEILGRNDKGDISFTVTDAIRRSERFLTELLLDGFLVNQNVVSRSDLERHIVHRVPFRIHNIRPLLACIAAEIWARTWIDRPADAADVKQLVSSN